MSRAPGWHHVTVTTDEHTFLTDRPTEGVPRLRWWRRVAGDVSVAATAAVAVLFVLGSWNPWDSVVLTYRFGNPMLGWLVVPVLAFVAVTVRWPIRNEARQRGRIAVRVAAAVLALFGLVAWGIFGQFFRYEVSVLAESADGNRRVVEVTNDWDNRSSMRVWDGAGLTAREVGVLGLRCGGTIAFLEPDLLEHRSGYGTWTLALDPDTGVPLQVLGARCPDGPTPATLEP